MHPNFIISACAPFSSELIGALISIISYVRPLQSAISVLRLIWASYITLANISVLISEGHFCLTRILAGINEASHYENQGVSWILIKLSTLRKQFHQQLLKMLTFVKEVSEYNYDKHHQLHLLSFSGFFLYIFNFSVCLVNVLANVHFFQCAGN